MSENFRIFPQMIAGGFLFYMIATSMWIRVTSTDLVVLPFVASLLLGGVMGVFRKPLGNWFLLFGSVGALATGTFFHYERIQFIIRNGDMERADGYGSLLAFLIGWLATTVVLFIPGLVFSIWNGRKIAQHRRLKMAADH